MHIVSKCLCVRFDMFLVAVINSLISPMCVCVMQRLEETFAQQLDEMETLYGGALIVSMPTDTLQRDQFTGSTRSSLSSYSEG